MEGFLVYTLASIVIVAGLLLWIVPLIILRGYVLVELWSWFIVPTFGLRPLTFAQALGVSLVVAFLTHEPPPSYKDHKTDPYITLVRPYIIVLGCWGFGYLYKTYLW